MLFRSLLVASFVVATTKADFAQDSCLEPNWVPSAPSSPTDKVRCCAKTYENGVKYGSCDTSSCINNFWAKNHNCFNYGSPQHPLDYSGRSGPQQGGAHICPYSVQDQVICDVSYYTALNGGDNCRRNPNDRHCLGVVRCGSNGVVMPQTEHSDGTATGGYTDPNAGTCGSNGFGAGATCFYDGASENWKVCKGDPIGDGDGGGFGDPHILTWGGEYFDYMGQCDLVLVTAPGFGGGEGLTVHIRTKTQYDYSYIEAAAIQIGDDILEVGSYGEIFFNGVDSAEELLASGQANMAEKYPIDYQPKNKKERIVTVHLGDASTLILKSWKQLVSVRFAGAETLDFQDSLGLMGDFYEGTRLARDGQTTIEDENDFGQEWQVLPTEPILFDSPPAPGKCVLPDPNNIVAQAKKRRLGEGISAQAAEAACAHVPIGQGREQCVYDVMATGDLGAAQAGAF